jgi:NAD(P)-dependent dehydrogenase (short-subunit alcohol dehydrogenase family)
MEICKIGKKCTLEDWNCFAEKIRGSIVNMSSRSGMVGIPHACAYASSKAAISNNIWQTSFKDGKSLKCCQCSFSLR